MKVWKQELRCVGLTLQKNVSSRFSNSENRTHIITDLMSSLSETEPGPTGDVHGDIQDANLVDNALMTSTMHSTQ